MAQIVRFLRNALGIPDILAFVSQSGKLPYYPEADVAEEDWKQILSHEKKFSL